MSKTIRYTLLSLRDLAVSAGPFIVLAVALLALAYWWLDPNPPKRVTLATGPAQSAYEAFGKRYATILAGEGIEVVLLPSEGSAANLQLLREGKADLGFVQGGTSTYTARDEQDLASLGSLFVEPLWLFYRDGAAGKVNPSAEPSDGLSASVGKSATLTTLTQLKGLRVNLGTPGSGVPSLMTKLLEVNRMDPADLKVSELEQTPATVAFLGGELDAIVFASAPESLMVQMLLQTPGVKLMNFAQSEAYSKRFPFLSPTRLPRGVVDLARNIPPEDVQLVAPTTSLITRSSTHPALQQLFAQAGNQIHGAAGWFKSAREYPNRDYSEQNARKNPSLRRGSDHGAMPWSRNAAQNRISTSLTSASASTPVASSSMSRWRIVGIGGGGGGGRLRTPSQHTRQRAWSVNPSQSSSLQVSIRDAPNRASSSLSPAGIGCSRLAEPSAPLPDAS